MHGLKLELPFSECLWVVGLDLQLVSFVLCCVDIGRCRLRASLWVVSTGKRRFDGSLVAFTQSFRHVRIKVQKLPLASCPGAQSVPELGSPEARAWSIKRDSATSIF